MKFNMNDIDNQDVKQTAWSRISDKASFAAGIIVLIECVCDILSICKFPEWILNVIVAIVAITLIAIGIGNNKWFDVWFSKLYKYDVNKFGCFLTVMGIILWAIKHVSDSEYIVIYEVIILIGTIFILPCNRNKSDNIEKN